MSVVYTLFGLFSWWAAARLGRPRAALDERARASVRALGALQVSGSFTALLRMDTLSQLQSLLRLVPHADPARPVPELVAAAAGGASYAMALGFRDLSARLDCFAVNGARQLDEPLTMARVEQCRGHTANFAGDVTAAARLLGDCVNVRGPHLENVDYLLAVGDLAGNLLLRGYARESLGRVEVALERVAIDRSGQALSLGHTYYCYGATALAMLGEVDEGRRRLALFGAQLEADDPWRKAHWHAACALFAVETGEFGAALDGAVGAFEAIVKSPRRCPLQMRHLYLAKAVGAFAQRDGSRAREKLWQRARRELAIAAGTHPSLRAHRLAVEAAYLENESDRASAEAARAEAEALAEAHDNPLVTWEIMVQRVALATRAGDRAEARRRFTEAEALAQREGWAPRLTRLRTAYRV